MAPALAAYSGFQPGEISPQEAWDALKQDARAVMVDVRTPPEWQFVGLPDLRGAKGRLLTVPWKLYPTFALNTHFAEQLRLEGVTPDTPLYFICRSGGRSLDAAGAMAALGFPQCYNVMGGFEGEPDQLGQRGRRDGWKADSLPWVQG